MRKAKTVCAIGPASVEPSILERLIDSGIDVVRLRFSHGIHDLHHAAIISIRAAVRSRDRTSRRHECYETQPDCVRGKRLLSRLALLAVLIGWLLMGGLASAQTGSLKQSPADVVKRYLTLDNKGARLDAMSAGAVASYTSWDEEPAWGHVVVTRGFAVAEQYRQWEIIDSLEVVIPVTFQVLGSVYWETAGFISGVETEEVRVRVKAVKNRWKIVEPMFPPHVGQKRMVNFVREAWMKETDPAKRGRLGSLRDELREAR
jgi:Pyruvate kinase, barrel domain